MKYYVSAILFALLITANSYAGPKEDAASAYSAMLAQQTPAHNDYDSLSGLYMIIHEYNDEYQASAFAQNKVNVQNAVTAGDGDKVLGDISVGVADEAVLYGEVLMQDADQLWTDESYNAANLKYIEAIDYFNDAKNFYIDAQVDYDNATSHYESAAHMMYVDTIFQENR